MMFNSRHHDKTPLEHNVDKAFSLCMRNINLDNILKAGYVFISK